MVEFYLDLSIFVAPKTKPKMKMKKRIILAAIGLFAMLGTSMAQTSVTPVDSTGVKPNCVAYYLPKTAVKVKVTVALCHEKPGPFANYAQRFLGIDKVITTESTRWELREVALEASQLPDETKQYQISVNSRSTAQNITVSADGIIKGVNLKASQEQPAPKTYRKEDKTKPSADPDYSVLGEDALVAGSIPKMAEMAARQLYRIRESRADLLAGEGDHTPDGKALKQMLEELDRQEQALVDLFVGKRVEDVKVVTYTKAPDQEIDHEVICRFSTSEGLVGIDDMVGRPLYITIKRQTPAAAAQPQKKAPRACGLYYNMPVKANVEVTDGDEVNAKASISMAQFGTVNHLPATLFNGTATVVRFNGAGAVVSIDQP